MRLAILLSVVWMASGSGYFYWQDQQRMADHAARLWKIRSDCTNENISRTLKGQQGGTCGITAEVVKWADDRQPDIWEDIGQSTFFLMVGWIIGGITYASVWWIRSGPQPR
jgi:hypothetical protein